MREYAVIYEHGPTRWGTYVPDLPACVAAGKAKEEVERLITQAIKLSIESVKADGQPIPEPITLAGMVQVAA